MATFGDRTAADFVRRMIRGSRALLNSKASAKLAGGRSSGVYPGNVVWIFGAGRTGSTWLAAMMEEIEGHGIWFEPRVGTFFNPDALERYGGTDFIFSPRYKKVWLRNVRDLILDGADARFPKMAKDEYLMIKEPEGSSAAPLLLEVLPESRMVLLVRDPRDVAASWLDATRKGGWQHKRKTGDDREKELEADKDPEAFVRRHANFYKKNVGGAKQAYDTHKGYKTVVRYEDLREDTLETMRRLYSTLDIPVSENELAAAVEKHAWENIPETKRGRGQFYRKASPGGWREDLTPQQARIVERITAPLLDEFYPEGRGT